MKIPLHIEILGEKYCNDDCPFFVWRDWRTDSATCALFQEDLQLSVTSTWSETRWSRCGQCVCNFNPRNECEG